MFHLKIIRTDINLHTGVKTNKIVLSARHLTFNTIGQVLGVFRSNNMLEGGDQVIVQNGGKTVQNYQICLICCRRARLKPTAICKQCTKKQVMPRRAPLAHLKKEASLTPHKNAKYYKHKLGDDEDYDLHYVN